jgi:cytochrome P450
MGIGDLARVGPNSLITGDIEVLHRMNGARSPYTRAPIYAILLDAGLCKVKLCLRGSCKCMFAFSRKVYNSLLTSSRIAASDTTATAIRSTLLYIITNPHVYRKLQAEIDSTRVVPGPIISDAQSKILPYLQAVIREGVRILPPTASTFAKVAPKDGDTVNGVFIPGGTEIGISIIAVLRNKKVFGEDVEIFRPERWITDDEGTFKTMEKSLNMIWEHGKYQCLGKDLAWMELNKIYFEVWSVLA